MGLFGVASKMLTNIWAGIGAQMLAAAETSPVSADDWASSRNWQLGSNET